MKFEIKHRLSGVVLFSLETESLKLCVEAADLARANLAGAYLAGADLARANLARAYLAAQLGTPNGWDAWTYYVKDGVQRVRVGCRDLTIAEGRAYWGGKENSREVLAALDYAEAIGRLRGWNHAAVKEAA